MDDLIRGRIHDALAVEQPPAGLRARVIGAVPMGKTARQPSRMPSFQLSAGLVAILVTAAIIAGLAYYRSSGVALPGGKSNPASPTRLISPEGIAIAPDGTLYVSDYLGNRVYQVRLDGTLLTVAGGGVATDGPATKANVYGPAGLAVDLNGDLYIADNLGGTIRRVDRGGALTTVAAVHGAGSNFNSPLGLALDRNGVLYVGNFDRAVVALRSDGSTSKVDLSSVQPPAVDPGYLAFDSAGNLYVADRNPVSTFQGQTVQDPGGGCRIIRIQPDRSVSVIAGTGTCGYSGDGGPAVGAELDGPSGIAFDSAGNLYFADSNNHRIRRVDHTGTISTVAGPGSNTRLGVPVGIAMAPGDLLYIADVHSQTGQVRLLRLSDGTISTVVSSQSRVVTPP